MEAPRRCYTFDQFTVDLSRASVLRNGERVNLRPKAFNALQYLLDNRGRIVTKEELIRALWPRVIVTDDSLTKCIAEVRAALSDDEHHYLKTVPRRGYLFDAPVTDVADEPLPAAAPGEVSVARAASAAARDGDSTSEQTPPIEAPPVGAAPTAHGHRWVGLAITVALVAGVAIGASYWLRRAAEPQRATLPKSVAVLPLENLSPDPDNAYFAAGIHDSILNQLAQIDDIKTIARTSTLRYAAMTKPISEIARELNVGAVMEGSVRYADGRVRVTVQLIDGETDVHLWSEEYDRPLADVLGIQTDIARRVAVALQAELSAEDEQLLGRAPAVSAEAYELYLRGRFHWDKTETPDFYQAIEYYEQAVRVDPAFAAAHAGLADTYTMLHGLGVAPPSELSTKAKAAAQRALEIDPALAEAYVSRGLIKHFFDWDFPGGDRDFEHAIALRPNLAIAHHLYGKDLVMWHRFDDSAAELERALQLDPYSAAINKDLGETFYYARRFPEALEQFRRTLELDPGSSAAFFWLARTYEVLGRRDEAVEHQLKIAIGRGLGDFAALEDIYPQSGWQGFWGAYVAALEALRAKQYVEPYKLVEGYVRAGDFERAFAWLETCLTDRSSWTPTIIIDPLVDPLRDDPRFDDLVRRAGLEELLPEKSAAGSQAL